MNSTMRITWRSLALLVAAAGLAASLSACNDSNSSDNSASTEKLTRIGALPKGAEVTGVTITAQGNIFMNVQHPADSNMAPFYLASVGSFKGFTAADLTPNLEAAPVPSTDAEKESVTLAKGEYEILGQNGQTFAGAVPFGLGTIVNTAGDTEVRTSNTPDFNAFVPTKDDGSAGYLFTNWETRPGGMSRLKLSQSSDGGWTVDEAMMVDFSAVQGTWVNCNGSMTPWGTPMTAEELYFDDTVNWNDPSYDVYGHQSDLDAYKTYLGGTFPNPYRIGFMTEITTPKGTPTPEKRFALGRMSHEIAAIMPDKKTVYLTSDGNGQAFFKFVADTAGDLSVGTLYAAKVTQDSGESDTAKAGFDVSWVKLAHASDSDIATWIADYDGITEADFSSGSSSYISDQDVIDWAAGSASDDRAAFLESVKAAAAKGASAEFNKMEGIGYNDDAIKAGKEDRIYVAMSVVGGTMSDTSGDVQLKENPCGVVYALKFNSNYSVTRMEPAVVGGPYDAGAADNQCSTDAISEPDNLYVTEDGVLVIGEDTGYHENNMIWAYFPATE